MARFSGHPWCWCRSSRPGWHHHLQAMIFFLGAQPLFNNDVEWCWTSPNPLKQKHVVKWNPHVQGLRIRTFTFFFLVRFSCLLVRTCWKTHHQPITNHPRIGRRKRLWRRQSAGVGRALPHKNCWVLQGKYPLKKTRVLSTQWTAKW